MAYLNPEQSQLQRARKTAFVLAAFLLLALISFVYAVIQQTKAKMNEQLLLRAEKKIIKISAQLDSCRNK